MVEQSRPAQALGRFLSGDPAPACEFCGGDVRALGKRRKRFCRDRCRSQFHQRQRLEAFREIDWRLALAADAVADARALLRSAISCGGHSQGAQKP